MTSTALLMAPSDVAVERPVRHLSVVEQAPLPTARAAQQPFVRSQSPRSNGARRPGGWTTRGRIVLTLLGALALACALVLAHSATSSAAESSPAPTTVVLPGQTLWSIAEQVAPSSDPRQTEDTLARLNHLDASSTLVPGEVLVLPRH